MLRIGVAILAAIVVVVALTVGVQLLIWGDKAPDWYAAVAMFAGLIAGGFGGILGVEWNDRARTGW